MAGVEAILAAADPATPERLRDRAMLEVFYSTGLRRTELARLKRYDANLSRLVVFGREGKGRKDRVVPPGECAALWLDKNTWPRAVPAFWAQAATGCSSPAGANRPARSSPPIRCAAGDRDES